MKTPNIFKNNFHPLWEQWIIYKSNGSEVSDSIKRKQDRWDERPHPPRTVCLQSLVIRNEPAGRWECGISSSLPHQSLASLLAPFITNRLTRNQALGSNPSIFVVGETKIPTFTASEELYPLWIHSQFLIWHFRTKGHPSILRGLIVRTRPGWSRHTRKIPLSLFELQELADIIILYEDGPHDTSKSWAIQLWSGFKLTVREEWDMEPLPQVI